MDKVRAQWRSASTEKIDGAEKMLLHHSRDTELKQWTETTIATLHAVCRVFTTQRNALLQLSRLLFKALRLYRIFLDDFGQCWESLLQYLEWAAGTPNAELSLAALKCFQEVIIKDSSKVNHIQKL